MTHWEYHEVGRDNITAAVRLIGSLYIVIYRVAEGAAGRGSGGSGQGRLGRGRLGA